MKKTFLIAITLIIFDVTILNYWVAIPAIFIVIGGLVITLFKFISTIIRKNGEPPTRKIWTRYGIYFFMTILIISMNMIDNHIAKSRGAVIIKYCEEFKLIHGEYPAQLTDLIPEYMNEIPSPKPMTVPGIYQFIYKRSDVVINKQGSTKFILEYISIPPHLLEIYDSERHEWRSLG